ncbi:MAG: sigma-70 family RNA polymerase sigma factor [Aggregatilineales bacterium]
MQNGNTPEIDWEAVYWELLPRLFNFFRYRTGDDQTAQDLTSTTMMRAWRSRERYNSEIGKFQAWVFSIARHVAVDHFRKSRPTVPLDAVYDLASDFSVEQEVQKQRDFARLYAKLTQLPEREQELIALKYGAGMTNREVAATTGLTESNVGTLLHRTIKKLRAEWELSYE